MVAAAVTGRWVRMPAVAISFISVARNEATRAIADASSLLGGAAPLSTLDGMNTLDDLNQMAQTSTSEGEPGYLSSLRTAWTATTSGGPPLRAGSTSERR
jgi:hypothetical protein